MEVNWYPHSRQKFTWIPWHDPTLRDINLSTWQFTWRNSKWIMALNHMYRWPFFLMLLLRIMKIKHIYITIHVWIYSIGTDIRTLNWNSSEFPDNLLLTSRQVYAVSQTAHHISLEDDKFKKRYFLGFSLYTYVFYSTLLYLPPLKFHCVVGCWDRIQDQSYDWPKI